MGQLGIGAMLHLLCGGSEKSSSDYEGAVIKSAALVDDRIQIAFDDGRLIGSGRLNVTAERSTNGR